MRGEQEMYDLILGYAERDPNVRGVILNGSRADPARRLDAFRDYDIVYLVTDVAPYKEGDISPAFGEVLVMQRTDESELYQEHYPRMACYLMQFADGSRIDLTIARVEDYRGYCFDDRLSMVLLDKDGFLPTLPAPADVSYGVGRPSPRLFQECRNEFWWTAPYVSKGLWRGQLLYAQHILEECTRPMLRFMLAWQLGGEQGFPVYPGKAGDRLGERLPPEVWRRYLSTYAPCEKDALFQALLAACELFTQASERAGKALGYSWEDHWDTAVPQFMTETQRDLAALPLSPSWDGELRRQMEAHGRKERPT